MKLNRPKKEKCQALSEEAWMGVIITSLKRDQYLRGLE